MDKVRVLLCDDHTLFREGIKAVLQKDPAIEVIGEADNGKDAVEMARRLRPDVILMDIGMPQLSGLLATTRIKRERPGVKILMLTMYAEDEVVAQCLEAGASGYVLKDSPLAQLVHAIFAVERGGSYLSSGSMRTLMSQARQAQRPGSAYARLTDREREVLQLTAEGLSAKEIAARLNLSVKTVEVHKYNLMRKLNIHDTAGLVKYAIHKKLIALH
jgi:RNA polymerase sigma factor (sigma-70 family)